MNVQMIPVPQHSQVQDIPVGGVMEVNRGNLARNEHVINCPCGCGLIYHAQQPVESGSVEGGDLTLRGELYIVNLNRRGMVRGGCEWRGRLINGVFVPA